MTARQGGTDSSSSMGGIAIAECLRGRALPAKFIDNEPAENPPLKVASVHSHILIAMLGASGMVLARTRCKPRFSRLLRLGPSAVVCASTSTPDDAVFGTISVRTGGENRSWLPHSFRARSPARASWPRQRAGPATWPRMPHPVDQPLPVPARGRTIARSRGVRAIVPAGAPSRPTARGRTWSGAPCPCQAPPRPRPAFAPHCHLSLAPARPVCAAPRWPTTATCPTQRT